MHKIRLVHSEFGRTKIEVEFLHPYLRNLNTIEKCWSKVKTHLRGAKAESMEVLYKEIGIALIQVTDSDAKNWIKSCGYG